MRLLETEAFHLARSFAEKYPFSFVIEGREYLRNWFGDGIETKLLLKEIASCHVSFTIGDSGAEFQKNGSVELLTLEEFNQLLNKYEGDFEALMHAIGRHYIEAQLWSDKYLNKCKD